MSNKRIKIQLISAWGCLLMGTGIYLLFRSREHLGFVLLDSVGLTSAVDALRTLTEGITVPEFVRFCLPDALWTSSYILFSDYLNRNERTAIRILWMSIIPLLGVISELLQFTGMIAGTFDPLDLACYTLPLLLTSTLTLTSTFVQR